LKGKSKAAMISKNFKFDILNLKCTTMHIRLFICQLIILIIAVSCNNKEPFDPPFENIGGYVIGNETCSTNSKDDYWLVDFTAYRDYPHIGDTIAINGSTYTNVLKVKGLHERLQHIGIAVSIDYNKISSEKVITTGCIVSNPITYQLKELFIINQFEMR
jgi:hypothetical protein